MEPDFPEMDYFTLNSFASARKKSIRISNASAIDELGRGYRGPCFSFAL